MRSQQSQSRSEAEDTNGLALMLANALSMCLTVFIRFGFGSNMPGVAGFVACVLLIICIPKIHGMKVYFICWFACLIWQRAAAFYLRHKKKVVSHSRYPGYPWLAMKLPFVRSVKVALWVEPVMCFLVGMAVKEPLPQLGRFIMYCAFAMFVQVAIEWRNERQIMERMRDAEIEQRYYSETYRGN